MSRRWRSRTRRVGVSRTGTAAAMGRVGALRRSVALTVATFLGIAGGGMVLAANSAPAHADGVFASGQVFASVGSSTVNVYDPTSGDQVNTLNDGTGETFTAGSAFDAQGNFYVTDDFTGQVSEYGPDGSSLGPFATGLSHPLSLVFDQQGNLYVGQQATPYIAEFDSSGNNVANIGPLTTGETGDDWIDLSSDQCTFFYTTETNVIYRYNKCTNTQLPAFNAVPFTGARAFEVRIMSNGDVLVADSNAVLELDQNGNQIASFPCSSLGGCAGGLFAVAIDPSGSSFWTGDVFSGNIWQVDLATGQVMQTVSTGSAYLYGLSVDDEYSASAPPPAPAPPPTTLTVQPVTGNFSTPTPVSAVLTNSEDAPIVDEPVVFTLNGNSSETCTATTDATGTATCDITANEPSSSYTLAATFSGDTSVSAPYGSDSSTTTFTVNPDTSGLDYTGPTTAVNGQPLTLSGTLTTNVPTDDTPLPTKVVTFTIGSGSTAQSCNAVTDVNGNVSCTIASVDQPATNETVTSNFAGDSYDTGVTVAAPVSVTEPTILTVNSQTSDYSDAATVSGVLIDANTNAPVVGEPVTLTLDGNETCTATTDQTGTASCSITPGEPAGTYTLAGSFAGDATLPLQLTSSTGSANYVVTLEETALNYTGGTVAQNGQPLTVSGVLTTDGGTAPLVGKPITFTLGTGGAVQTCAGTTTSTGAASCVINVTGQPPGPIPVVDSYAGDAYYQPASAASTVNLPEGTRLTVTPGTGTYGGSTTVSATLVNTTTNAPVPNEQITLVVNGSQTCTATTNASGVGTCAVTPNEPAGTYTLTASFTGDTATTPILLASSGAGSFVENKAPTTLTYTGSTSVVSGQTPNLSATLTTTSGTPLPGQTVTFTVGTGSSAQHCSATTNAAGMASCHVCNVNQSTGSLPVTVTYGGNSYDSGASTSASIKVTSPTTLTVAATTGTTGQALTLTGTLTNAVTGQGIPGQSITLSLNGVQSCTATTDGMGQASCSVTPNENPGTYAVTGTFAGNTTTSPQLLASSGCNQVVVKGAPTTLTYTGVTTATDGKSLTLSATLTSNGTPLAGQSVVLTLGAGYSAQSCTAITSASGAASCTITSVNQVAGSVVVTASFGGTSLYQAASTSSTVKISGSGGSGGGGGGGGGSGGGGGCGGGYSLPPPTNGGRGCN